MSRDCFRIHSRAHWDSCTFPYIHFLHIFICHVLFSIKINPRIFGEKLDKPPVSEKFPRYWGSKFCSPRMWTCPDDARLLRRVAPRCRAPHFTTRVFGHSVITPFLCGKISQFQVYLLRSQKATTFTASFVFPSLAENSTRTLNHRNWVKSSSSI